MKNMSEIIASIGEDEYYQACSDAKKAATGTGTSLGKGGFDSNVPHDISSLVWDAAGDTYAKAELIFRFYEAMPCYGYLMYISMHIGDFSAETKELLWSKYKQYLAGDDQLADPVAYSLWCDFFEDQTRVHDAWDALTSDISNEPLLRRVLVSSGPVPFDLKEVLYQQLLPHQEWHYHIFRSLLHSQFDVYGCIDRVKARSLLKKLVLPGDTENLNTLKDALR